MTVYIQHRTVEQVVGMHDQPDVHTGKMEHLKIIKNTAKKKNPIHPGEDQSGAMQSQFHSIQAVQKPWKSTRMKDVLVDTQRLVPTMQKLQNTKW